ncbi:DUF4412 domain-containing protein [Neolewinella persica]|uniref:DUF4412 domain-containing protein n=1 Tax=Neolewinella persica TaxID=70998 RepID=UPI000371CB35|nr:DUF4412 domain-containing protein [Neolewinella persica]
MKFRSFLTLAALFLTLSLFAQTTAERAGTRAKNRAENRANSRVDQKVDSAVDDAFNAVGNLFKKKKKKNTGSSEAPVPAGNSGPGTTSPSGNTTDMSADPWVPYTNPVSFSLTMDVTEVKRNGKENKSTIKMAVVSDKFGMHMFSEDMDDASSRMILNTQDGKTTMVTTTKNGKSSAFRMRVPRMGKILDNTTAEIEDGRFTFEATGERKQVDGYNCEKIIVKDTKEGTTTESWVTEDLNFDAQEIYRSFAGMAGASKASGPNAASLAGGYKGFPIESTTTDGDKTFRMNFKEIKIGEDKMDKSVLDLTGVEVVEMGF